MKNYFIKKAKKYFSVALALLMVMSCWVWVAPDEAIAADKEAGQYQARLICDIPDNGQCTAISITVYYKDASGNQQSVSMTGSTTNMCTAGDDLVIGAATDIPSFPIGYDFSFTIDKCNGHAEGTYQNFELQVYNNNSAAWVKVNNDDSGLMWTDASGDKSATMSGNTGCQTKTDAYPAVTSITMSEASASCTIPALGSTSAVTPGAITAKCYDQYGVRMLNSYATDAKEYYVADNSGTKLNSTNSTDYGAYISSKQLYINANLQKNVVATSSGTGAIYLYASYDDITAYTTINLTYPTYTVLFDANGRTGSSENAVIKLSSGTASGSYQVEKPYGLDIKPYPTGGTDDSGNKIGATKTGYTFKGYWTNEQPASGDSSITAYEADFASPVSSTEYEAYCSQSGATVSNGVVTLADGSKYCNGGTEWNPEDITVKGDTTYYGWWIAKDITAKFYDIDGKYLGTMTYKYGVTVAASDYPNPLDSYVSGSYTYNTFSGVWQNVDGIKITEGSYTFGTDGRDSLILTPVYTTKTYQSTYTIKFKNPLTGGNLGSTTTFDYRADIGDYQASLGANITQPAALSTDVAYTYVFEGWSENVPSTGKNYHLIDEDNTAFKVNTDWIVKEDVTYYPVFRSYVKSYAFEFSYIDSTGNNATYYAELPYYSLIGTPDGVNVTYAKNGYSYTLEKWIYIDADYNDAYVNNGDSVVFDNSNFLIGTENLADGVDVIPILIEASYGAGVPAPYTITFKYKNEDGTEKTIVEQVYHGNYITDEIVAKLDVVPATYDDGTALYTFSALWEVTEGAADADSYSATTLTSFSPTSHVTFEALYDDGVPFYTVEYIDGALSYEERILKGSNVPAWMVSTGEQDENGEDIMEEYVPEDYETDTGTYEFAGWFNEKQTDTTYAQTNGTQYTTQSIVEGNLVLYPQYIFEPFKYTISFWNYDKSVQLAAVELEAGQSFAAAFYQANTAAQYRASDEVYSYTFIGWDQPYNEDNLVCEGKDVTYVAQYKPSYVYYKANWYNSASAITADEEPLVVTNHTYGSKLYSPSVTVTPPEASAGYTNVFTGWFYLADGVETAYERGMTITSDMSFYATYKEVAKAVTVTTVVNGTETEYKVEYNTAAKISDPSAGYIDETSHNAFDGWYTDSTYTTEYDMDTPVTADIKIYAKISVSAHDKTMKELVSAPTYYAEGSEKIWCSCNKEETIETVAIPMLTDNVKPTGTIYLGTLGSWSSETGDHGNATDNEEISLFANGDTTVVLITNDTGDVNTVYNPGGTGKGIKSIKAFVFPAETVLTATNYGAAQSLAYDVYTDTTEELTNAANFTVKLNQLIVADLDADGKVQYEDDGSIKYKSLQDGEAYIIYYYVIDKAGNMLNTRVRTAKFVYDITAPTFTVEGTGNGTTYCGEATVAGVESGATVTVNGAVVTLTNGEYVITDAGNYIIVVTDKAGNKTSKKIVVADGHTEVTSTKKATCEEGGYSKVTCAICQTTISETTTDAIGHNYKETTVAATCTEAGKKVETCANCGKVVETETEAALGHTYIEDAEGNIVYTVVTKATCKAVGKEIANCTRCGGATLTQVIPVDTVNGHVYGGTKSLKATCTEDGYYYQSCKYCYTTLIGDTIPATGHVETYTEVTTKATCGTAGEETTKCKKCQAVISTAEIPATGKHVVYEDTSLRVEPTETTTGSITYKCQTCSWEKTEEIATLELYDVTFVDEDGSTVATFTDKVKGTSVAEDDVTAPTKTDATGKYSYKFAGWKDADGKTVSFPYEITADATLTAYYTQTTIIYTHIFKVPTKWATTLSAEDMAYTEFATIMGAMGDTNKKPVAEPVFSDADETVDAQLKKIYTFEFLGWSTTGAAGDIVTDFTITEDATYFAVFNAVPIEYKVTYYNGTEFVWQTTVKGGESVTFGGTIPAKAYTDENHYTFYAWYTDATLKTPYADSPITADTRLYAGYTEEAHSFDKSEGKGTVTQNATCVLPEETSYTCLACAYIDVVETKEANGHTPGEAVTETAADGTIYKVVYCTVEDCKAEISRSKASVTIAFKNWNGVRLDTQVLALNSAIVYGGAEPTRASDAEKNYTFAGWAVENTTEIVDLTNAVATTDIAYVAQYTETVRTFRVTYVDINNTTLQTIADIPYDGEVPAFTGTEPTKEKDDFKHYEFTGWSVEAGTKVTADIVISPVFDGIDHTYGDGVEFGGSCTEASGMKYECTACGHSYVSGGKPASGHKLELIATIAPEGDVAGKLIYACKNCIYTEEAPLPADYFTVKVTVLDENGNAVEFARVDLLDTDGNVLMSKETNNEGVVIFSPVASGTDYKVYISYTGEVKDVSVDENGKVTGGNIQSQPEQEIVDTSCKCSCHKGTFWGIIFRLFQKLIKMFTGKPTCCACPDSRI